MNIVDQLVTVFPRQSWASFLNDDFILANQDLMQLEQPKSLLEVVPAYMLWCAENPRSPELVSDFTLSALAEYGRSKSAENPSLNFRYLCSSVQAAAVVAFLRWASNAIPLHHEAQLRRAIHSWEYAANFSSEPTC